MLCKENNNMLTQGVIITFLDFTIILLLKPLGSQPQKFLVRPAFHTKIVLLECILKGRQRGRVVSASDSQSGSRGVRVPHWPLAGFVLNCPKFKSSATLVNSQLVASCQLGF